MTQQDIAGAGAVEPNPFATDAGDELPVGLQLSWRLRALISTGQLASGERLPSFRRLAEWAGVNVNTVRSVYEGLEQEGLVVSRQGQGTFVADGVEGRLVTDDTELAYALAQLATDPGLRRTMAGHNARVEPATTWPVTLDAVQALYDRAAAIAGRTLPSYRLHEVGAP